VFGNFLVHNLKELAKFDGLTDIRDNFGSKLNIDTSGRFELVKGFKAAARRTSASSMTNEYNRKTVENLLKAAIHTLFTDGIQRNPELRKAIFDGIRGYIWLLESYGLDYTQSMKEILIIKKEFTDAIKAAINTMDKFHLCYGTAQPEMKLESFGQAGYMKDKGLLASGICAGITTKWLVRWVSAGKASMLDSSKAVSQERAEFNLALDTLFNSYKTFEKTKWMGDIAKYGGEAAAMFQVKERLKKEKLDKEFGLRSPDLARLQKKGSGMYIAMQEQGKYKEGGNLQDIIQDAAQVRENAQTAPQKIQDLTAKLQANPLLNRSERNKILNNIQKLQRHPTALNDVAERNALATNDMQRLDQDHFLQRMAQAYQNAHSQKFQKCNFAKPMYFRDASDFEIELNVFFRPLISDSEMSMGLNQRTAYYIAWQGKKYSSNDFSGHALGFHINQDRTFMVFDPNYGEFGCATGNEVIQHFARWFSLYSKDTVIDTFGYMRVYQDQIDPLLHFINFNP